LVIEVPVGEVPEPAAFAFFAWRLSFSDLLAAVFELFRSPKKSSWGRMERACAWLPRVGGEGDFGVVPGLKG
jgi:hypothetical protein